MLSQVSEARPGAPRVVAAEAGSRTLELCFNSRNGYFPEGDGSMQADCGSAQGAGVRDGGAGAGVYVAPGAGADCAGAVLQPLVRLLQ